jgi:hypothetical protein
MKDIELMDIYEEQNDLSNSDLMKKIKKRKLICQKKKRPIRQDQIDN